MILSIQHIRTHQNTKNINKKERKKKENKKCEYQQQHYRKIINTINDSSKTNIAIIK